MAAVLVSSVPAFDTLTSVVSAAAAAFDADAVAGVEFFGRVSFGVVAVNEAGAARLCETMARGAGVVIL